MSDTDSQLPAASSGRGRKKRQKALVYFFREDPATTCILPNVDSFIERSQQLINTVCNVKWTNDKTYEAKLLAINTSSVELKRVEVEFLKTTKGTHTHVDSLTLKQQKKSLVVAKAQAQHSLQQAVADFELHSSLTLPCAELVSLTSTSPPYDDELTLIGEVIQQVDNEDEMDATLESMNASLQSVDASLPSLPCLCAGIASSATPDNVAFLEGILHIMKRSVTGNVSSPSVAGPSWATPTPPEFSSPLQTPRAYHFPGPNDTELVAGSNVYIDRFKKAKFKVKYLKTPKALTRKLLCELGPDLVTKSAQGSRGTKAPVPPSVLQAVEIYVSNKVEEANKTRPPLEQLKVPDFNHECNQQAAMLRRVEKRVLNPDYGRGQKVEKGKGAGKKKKSSSTSSKSKSTEVPVKNCASGSASANLDDLINE